MALKCFMASEGNPPLIIGHYLLPSRHVILNHYILLPSEHHVLVVESHTKKHEAHTCYPRGMHMLPGLCPVLAPTPESYL